tara:strand:+ start:21 stop:245 length:225 start_codon:yes stop_codon:yes gene_type:complete
MNLRISPSKRKLEYSPGWRVVVLAMAVGSALIIEAKRSPVAKRKEEKAYKIKYLSFIGGPWLELKIIEKNLRIF